MNLFSLDGRVALVTGASRGLGLAMAQALAAAGAHVVLAARDEARLAEVAEGIRRTGGRADVEAFDLLDEDAVVAAVPRIVARHGKLDILLNIGRERLTAYVASKHGLAGLTKSLAGELGRHNITCNGIAPGFFETEMAAPILNHPVRAKIFTDAVAMGRWGKPQELAGAAVFLASDAASYINGHMLHVDGGVAEVLSLPVAVTSAAEAT